MLTRSSCPLSNKSLVKLTSMKVNARFFIGRNGQLGGADASDNEMRMVVGISRVLYFSCRDPRRREVLPWEWRG